MTLAKFNKLKRGQRVKFTKKVLSSYKKHSFTCCTVGGVLRNEQDAMTYIPRKLLGLGFKHDVYYIGKEHAADPKNTGYFRVYLGNNLGFEAYFDRQDFSE